MEKLRKWRPKSKEADFLIFKRLMKCLAFFPKIVILRRRDDQNWKSLNFHVGVHQIVYFSILWGCPLQNEHFWGNWCQRHREYKSKNGNFAWEVLRKSLPCILKEKSKNVNFDDPSKKHDLTKGLGGVLGSILDSNTEFRRPLDAPERWHIFC